MNNPDSTIFTFDSTNLVLTVYTTDDSYATNYLLILKGTIMQTGLLNIMIFNVILTSPCLYPVLTIPTQIAD
jgi:hypothetical protein